MRARRAPRGWSEGLEDLLPVLAITVDAKDERAAAFYEKLGFTPFPRRPNRLFLLASSALRGLEKM